MDITEYKKRFAILYRHLLGTCATYHSWKGLQDKEFELSYQKAIYFWKSTLIALQNEWLVSLAKCFEDSSFSEDNSVISVQALLKHYLQQHSDSSKAVKVGEFLEKHKRVIANIHKLRHKQLAHLDAKHAKDPTHLLKKYPIDYGEVEDLLAEFTDLLSSLNPEPGVGYSLDNFTKTPEREAKYTMSKILYFDKKEREHLDRFSTGEVDDPFFPPKKAA